MKNTSRIMTPIAVAVVLCLVLLQNQLSTPQAVDAPAGGGSVEQGVVLNLDDAHQEDESDPAAQVDVDNNADLGNNAYQDSSDEPVGQPEDANPSSQTDTHSGVDPPSADLSNVDLGEDLELNEGITDRRAEQYLAAQNVTVTRDGTYTSKVEVALYIHTFGTVPSNYISKTKARNAGWESTKGNLDEVLPGKSIGGGGYSNESWYGEPLLPETQEGRFWHECDINYAGGYRGPERLVYSEDGLVFYTGDHYETFERLY